MSTFAQVWSRPIAIGWAFTIAAAFAVYFGGISHEPIWYDEAISATIANRSFAGILAFMPNENHPPLHFLLLHVARLLFGNSEWALRLPSALGAVGLVALGAGPVRRLLGDRTAFAYAGVALFLPAILINAHEARGYSLCTLAVTAAVLYGFLAATEGRTRDWVSFAVATLAAGYLHYYGLIAAALAQGCVVLWVLLRKREQTRRCLITAAVAFLGYLPWIAVFVGQTARVNRDGFWVPRVSGQAILAAFFRPFSYRELFLRNFPEVRPWMATAFVLSVILVVAGLVLVIKRRAKTELPLAILLLGVYLGTMVVTICISLVSTPIFYDRYMVVCAGLLALLVSLGIGQLPRVWLAGALATFAIANALTMKDVYTQYFNLPFRDLLAAVEKEVQPGDLVVTSSFPSVGPAFYYFPQAVHFYTSNKLKGVGEEVVRVMSPRLHYDVGLNELLATRQSFWCITDSLGSGRDIADILASTPGWQLTSEPRTFTGVAPYALVNFSIAKYEYTGRQGPLAGYGNIKVHVSGLRPVGNVIVALQDRFPPEPKRLPFRLQLASVSSDQLDVTVSAIPHGDYVLLLLHDENGDFQYGPGEAVWIYNRDKAEVNGFVFDVLKFPFHEPERTFEAQMHYQGG